MSRWNPRPRLRSHESRMSLVSPHAAAAQTAADVSERTFVNIYPAEERVKLREAADRAADLGL